MRKLVGTLGVAIALATASAQWAAAQNASVILYDGPNFTGEQRPLSSGAGNLGRISFNDRTESIVVVSGVWRVCSDINYRGRCQTLGPGSYPNINTLGLSNTISSLQPSSTAATPEIRVYVDGGFTGRSERITGSVSNLGFRGLNDNISSIQVLGGTWKICSDVNYRGRCQTLSPGSYDNLDFIGLRDMLSSIELVGENVTPGITLYQEPNFQGRSVAISADAYNLGSEGFNDLAASVIVSSGTWEVCENVGFRGRCQRLSAGTYSNLGSLGLSRTISSVRPVQ